VCLKQSLPFVRCVGEGWPLSQDRCRIEAEALMLEYKLCPEHTPQVRADTWAPGGGGHEVVVWGGGEQVQAQAQSQGLGVAQGG
jgi:hypothetical protein